MISCKKILKMAPFECEEDFDVLASLVACEAPNAYPVIRTNCIKPLSLKKLDKYLNNPRKLNKRLGKCQCEEICCPWKGLSEFKRRRRERAEELKVLDKVMKLLEMPHLTFHYLDELPYFDTFPRNTWVIGSFFYAFDQSWTVRYMLLAPPRTEILPHLQCSFLFVLHLESPDTCLTPLRLSYTLTSCKFMDMRFTDNVCENYNFTPYNLDGHPAELYKNSFQNVVKLLKEPLRFRIFMVPTKPKKFH